MFVPSERIYKEMQYEPAGFWPVPINKGDEYAFLLKAPTSVIKAVYRSAPVVLSIAWARTSIGTVMATSLSVADDPSAPLGISGIQRHAEEQTALIEILRLGKALFVFFDELSRPVLRAECLLAPDECAAVLDEWRSIQDWYVGSWVSPLPAMLDEVDAIVDPTKSVVPKYYPKLQHLHSQLTGFEIGKTTTIGASEVRDFTLDGSDEGYGLEQSTWHLLENLFAPNIFHSPQVQESKGIRELIDILGYCEAGICLIEAKAIAVLSTDMKRSTSRRAKNIRKQINKGLEQLPGAMRNLAASAPLRSKDGQALVLPGSVGSWRIGVIMVSELLPSVDWAEVAQQLIGAATAVNAPFVVLDLQELRLLVGISKTPEALLAHLVRRFDIMIDNRSALIRSKLDGPPLP